MGSKGEHTLVLSLPNDVLDRWNQLSIGSSIDLTTLRSALSEEVDVSLSKAASSTLLQITGRGIVDVSKNKYVCTLTNTVVSSASITNDFQGSETETHLSPAKDPDTCIPGETPSPAQTQPPARRSSRVKREPIHDDFIVATKRRRVSGQSEESHTDRGNSTATKKRCRGRPAKLKSSSPDVSAQAASRADHAKMEDGPENYCDTGSSKDVCKESTSQMESHNGLDSTVENGNSDLKVVPEAEQYDTNPVRVKRSNVSKSDSKSAADSCDTVTSHDGGLKMRKGKSIPKTEPPEKAENLTSSPYSITDAELTDWPSNKCLLCGKQWKVTKALKNHLYVCHKVSNQDHEKVLVDSDVGQRQKSLSKLQELSKRQMKLSGRHCPVCLKGSASKKLLQAHMKTHGDQEEYKVSLDKFKKESEENEGIVSLCRKNVTKKRSKNQDTVIQNAEQHESQEVADLVAAHDQPIQCCICTRHYESGLSLRRHLVATHKVTWVEYVGLLTLSPEERAEKIHEIRGKSAKNNQNSQLSIDGQIIQCTECPKMVPCESYRDHLKNVHPDCIEVDSVVSRMEEVLANTSYQAIFDFVVDCTICNTAVSMKTVRKHFKSCHKTHSECKSKLEEVLTLIRQKGNANRTQARIDRNALSIRYTCRYCRTVFFDRSTRSAHENHTCSKNERRKRFYTCKYCGQKGTTEKWYNEHMVKHNPSGSNYVCVQCGMTYKNRSGIQQHMAMIHKNISRFVCEICAKQFYLRSHYKAHMIKHTDVRQHTCDICNKAFKREVCLRKHKQTMHTAADSWLKDDKSIVPTINIVTTPAFDARMDLHSVTLSGINTATPSHRAALGRSGPQLVSLLKNNHRNHEAPTARTVPRLSESRPDTVDSAILCTQLHASNSEQECSQTVHERQPSAAADAESGLVTKHEDVDSEMQEVQYLNYNYLENCVNVVEASVSDVSEDERIIQTVSVEGSDGSLPTFIVVKTADTEDSTVLDLSSLVLMTTSEEEYQATSQ